MDGDPASGTDDLLQDLVARFRSDELTTLRQVLAWAQRQMPYFKLPPRFYLIPDTNCILKEIDYLCRRRVGPGRTALEEVVDAGLVRLFAPLELDHEMTEHLVEFAIARGGEPAEYLAEWARYKTKIHLFRAPDDSPVTIADPDDAFLIRAMNLLCADAVVTDDAVVIDATKALRPTAVQRVLRTISRDEAVRLGLSVYGMLAAVVYVKAVGFVGASIWRNPKIGIPILLFAALGAYLYDRKAVEETGTSVIRKALGSAGRGVVALLHAIEEHANSTKDNLDALGDVPATRELKVMVTANLIAAGEPLSLDHLVEEIHLDGYDPWAACPENTGEALQDWTTRAWQQFRCDVDRLLRSDPRCVWNGGGWTTRLLLGERDPPARPDIEVESTAPVPGTLPAIAGPPAKGVEPRNDAPKVTAQSSPIQKKLTKSTGQRRKAPKTSEPETPKRQARPTARKGEAHRRSAPGRSSARKN
jgi:hypothetical protein